MDASHARVADAAPLEDGDIWHPCDRVAHAPRRIVVERAELRAVLTYQAAWADLADRALEPNIFLDPAFALPLAQHVGTSRRGGFLLAWEESDEASFGRLVALLPIQRGFLLDRVVRGYANEQVCLGVPLLDRDRALEAWTVILEWLSADSTKAALALTSLPRDGAFFRLLVAGGMSSRLHVLEERRRAILRRAEGRTAAASFRSAKRRKEARRQRHRLADLGARTFVSARTPAEVRNATERFLALEHGGWKGRSGALLTDPSLATFTRTMTRLLAHEGKCRIDSLELDGRPVAMGIVITAGDRAHFWKTTFDEDYAPLSPGVQLALEITERQLADADVAVTDSCAAPDHPMIDRLWCERMAVVDVVLDLQPLEPGRFDRVLSSETAWRAARRKAKALFVRVRALVRKRRRQ